MQRKLRCITADSHHITIILQDSLSGVRLPEDVEYFLPGVGQTLIIQRPLEEKRTSKGFLIYKRGLIIK